MGITIKARLYTTKQKAKDGVLLDEIFEEKMNNCSKVLNGQTVCMILDGWINIINEAVICVTVTTSSGRIYLIRVY